MSLKPFFDKLSDKQTIKTLVWLLVILIVIAFPKPQRIVYQYGGMKSESTYWDGLGASGMLFDAKAEFVKLDKDTDYLTVCYSLQDDGNCIKYRVVENKGFFGFLFSWL